MINSDYTVIIVKNKPNTIGPNPDQLAGVINTFKDVDVVTMTGKKFYEHFFASIMQNGSNDIANAFFGFTKRMFGGL